jgi:hypothetical protein
VLRFGATGSADQLPLLEQVRVGCRWRCGWPSADSEFRKLDVQRWCQQQHWHWQVGLHNTLLYRTAEGSCQPLQRLGLSRGQRRYVQHVWLGAQGFGPVILMADWPVTQAGPHYWAVDLPANPLAWRRGRKRPSSPLPRPEERWLRSGRSIPPDRLERLLLGMASPMCG